MAQVEIKPHVGTQRNDAGALVADQDTGIDAIFLVSREWPVPRRVGFVGRDKGAAVCLIVNVSDSERAAIQQAVADRHQQQASQIAVAVAESLQKSK